MGVRDDHVILGDLAMQQTVPIVHHRYRPRTRVHDPDTFLCYGVQDRSNQAGGGPNVCLRLADAEFRIEFWQATKPGF